METKKTLKFKTKESVVMKKMILRFGVLAMLGLGGCASLTERDWETSPCKYPRMFGEESEKPKSNKFYGMMGAFFWSSICELDEEEQRRAFKALGGTKGEEIKNLPAPSSHSVLDDYFDWDFSFSARDLVKYLYLIKSSKDKSATQLVGSTFSPLFAKHWRALEELSENLRDPNPLEDDYCGAKLAMAGLLERYFPLVEELIQDARALAKEAEKFSIDEDPQVARMLSNALPQDSLESLKGKVSEEKECE